MIRRLLLCGGVNGSADALQSLQRLAMERQPDAILFAGGIVNPERECAVRATPWSLSRGDGLLIEDFFATLGRLGIFTAFIPGPVGIPLAEFLQLAMHAEEEFPTVHSAHATLIEHGEVAVSGLGGPLAEHPLIGVDSLCRTMAEYHLRPLWKAKQARKILLLSSPPPGSLGGAEGSPLVGELIDSFHPELCLVAGETSHRGTLRIAKTLIVNPGCLIDGSAAWLDWSRPRDEQVEFLDLKSQAVVGGCA